MQNLTDDIIDTMDYEIDAKIWKWIVFRELLGGGALSIDKLIEEGAGITLRPIQNRFDFTIKYTITSITEW